MRLQCAKPRPGYPLAPITIGDRIKRRRIDLKIKQRAVAKLLGVGRRTLQSWEASEFEPDGRFQPAIEQFLENKPEEA